MNCSGMPLNPSAPQYLQPIHPLERQLRHSVCRLPTKPPGWYEMCVSIIIDLQFTVPGAINAFPPSYNLEDYIL